MEDSETAQNEKRLRQAKVYVVFQKVSDPELSVEVRREEGTKIDQAEDHIQRQRLKAHEAP